MVFSLYLAEASNCSPGLDGNKFRIYNKNSKLGGDLGLGRPFQAPDTPDQFGQQPAVDQKLNSELFANTELSDPFQRV